MQFFEDEDAYVKGGLTKAFSADIAASPSYLDQFDSLVVADIALPADALGRDLDPAAFYANLRAWVERGGNLVLTDRALHALEAMGLIDQGKVTDINVYQPYANIADLEHPMVQGLRGNARQLSEATLIGYGIGNSASPMTVVTTEAWEAAGGHIVATTGAGSGGSDDGSQTSVGQLKLGDGQVRIMGGGLHMPTEENDHRYGLKDYSLTYSGLYILENSMKYNAPNLGLVTSGVTQTRLALTDTRSGQFTDSVSLGAKLTDAADKPIADALVTLELSEGSRQKSWTGVTGSDGSVSIPVRLLFEPGNYMLSARFDGETDVYGESLDATPFVIEKEDTHMLLKRKGKGRSSRLVATVSDLDSPSSRVVRIPVSFRVRRGKILGSTVTDGKGRAIKHLAKRFRGKKRTFVARFDGTTDTYWNGSARTLKRRGRR
jgi:hypothetical protein